MHLRGHLVFSLILYFIYSCSLEKGNISAQKPAQSDYFFIDHNGDTIQTGKSTLITPEIIQSSILVNPKNIPLPNHSISPSPSACPPSRYSFDSPGV